MLYCRSQPCANGIANGIRLVKDGNLTFARCRSHLLRQAATRAVSNIAPAQAREHAPTPTDPPIFMLNLLDQVLGPTMNSNKRSATASGTGTAASGAPKKRKTDNVQKYYAVQAGFLPGVYLTYAECQAQTAGFRGAVFKSFLSMEDAEAFAAGKKVQAAPDEPAKFYAVAVGNPTGIYTEWAEASKAITGIKGPKYKRFGTRAEAVAYIKQFGNRDAIEALGETSELDFEPLIVTEPAPVTKKANPVKEAVITRPRDNALEIYTDGSSLANGKAGARAGFGVFFGDNDPRNVSERLQGEPQTNQRAELTAILRALEIAPVQQPVRIFSDSQYSIKCVTEWAIGWKKKNWMTAGGGEVKNQDIIREVLARMEERTKAGGNTYFQWVKGHAADKGNIAADRLAVRGANMA